MTKVNVRYIVDDVPKAVAFYRDVLGFSVVTDYSPAFASVTLGGMLLMLAGPASSAARPMPDGRKPAPGGWLRVQLEVDDIDREVARLRAAGVAFRNDVISGPGGRQVLVEDPSGNPIEIFQPAASQPGAGAPRA